MDARVEALIRIFGDAMPVVEIMDIGAMPEGQERYAPLLQADLARVVGFEPNPEQFARLDHGDARRRYFMHFLGHGGPATFRVTRYPGCCSLYEPDPAVIDLFVGINVEREGGGDFQVVERRLIETRRLDDIAEAGQPDLVKLDTQGSELDILRHGMKRLDRALVIECETEFVPLYKGQPLFGDIQAFLSGHGFVMHKMIDLAGMPLFPFKIANSKYRPVSQMLWADTVFVRDFTRLDHYDDDQLLRAAIILDVVYHSFDLAGLLIRERDRRLGTDSYPRYQASLGSMREEDFLVMNWRT